MVPVTSLLFTVGQQAYAQQKLPLNQAVKQIEQRFNANLSYEHNLLNGKFVDPELLKGNKLEEVLKKVLYPNQLVFLYVDDRSYSIVRRAVGDGEASPVKNGSDQQAIDRVAGTVVSASGKPIPLASIWVKDTRKGAKSDENGRFLIYDIKPTDIIMVSAVGYESTALTAGNRSQIMFTMEEKNNVLEEAVISTGYQKISKERATGSVSLITSKELEKIPSANLIQRLE